MPASVSSTTGYAWTLRASAAAGLHDRARASTEGDAHQLQRPSRRLLGQRESGTLDRLEWITPLADGAACTTPAWRRPETTSGAGSTAAWRPAGTAARRAPGVSRVTRASPWARGDESTARPRPHGA